MGMNTIANTLGTVQAGRKESPAIWGDCPVEDLLDPRSRIRGLVKFDDFNRFPLGGTQTTQIGFADGYKVFATSAGSLAGVVAVNSVQAQGGILAMLTDSSADNESVSLAEAYPSFSMTGDTTKDGKLWFETCIAVSSIVAAHISFMVGLAETNLWTLATGVPYSDDTGAAITNSASFVGFKRIATATTTVDTAYSDRATGFTAIGTGDVTGIAAYTFFKLGMKYDPGESAGNVLKFFLNNIQLTNVMTATVLAATTNLKAHNLGLIAAAIGGSAPANVDGIFLDWWRCAQIFPNG
jgi:hypothetical protein